MKEYLVIEQENSKYKKDVPYITKKEFKKIENSNLVGATVLKEYDEDTNSDKYGILNYNEEQYRYKEKYFGWKKGYISVDNNDFIILKTRIPFLLLFLFLLLLLILMFFFINPKEEEIPVIDNTPVIEEKIPDPPIEEKEEPKQEVNTKPSKPSIQKTKEEKYLVKYDANGGYGKVDAITCIKGKECLITEKTFSKEGHTFEGWALTKDGDLIYDSKSVFDETNLSNNEIILYAKWKVNEYKISFIDYDETILSEQTLTYDSVIENIPVPTRNGYIFDKWDNELKKVSEDTTYKATYKISNYNILFELNGGLLEDEIETYNVESESFEINEPTKEGYTFTGWSNSNDEELVKKYKIEQGTTGDITLIAHYEPNNYFIKYNTDSENNYNSKEVEFLSNYGELVIPEKKGYTFVEWKDKDDNVVNENNILDKASDVNIYANWKINDYKITYELNGGKLNNLIESYNIESKTFTIGTPKKEGYTFIGWKINNLGDLLKKYTIEKGTIGDINLVANYSPNSYNVKYDANGGIGTMEDSKYVYDKEGTLTKNVFTYEGKNFIGWSLTKDGEVLYKDGEQMKNLTNVLNDEVILYAKWETKKFTVKFYDMFDILLSEQTVEYGKKPTIPKTSLWEGHTFTGWTPEITIIKDNVDYVANFTKDKYTITFDFNRGKQNDTKDLEYYVDTETFVLEHPTREGYTFIGWTGSNGIRKTLDVTIQKGSTGNRTYKANWQANSYNITLNPNGGNVLISNVYVPFDSEYGILPIPTRTGYTFEGWYYNDTLINEDTSLKINSNHELIAKWKVIDYKLEYNLNGGTANLPSKYNVETESFTLETPIKTGYIFTGWTGSNGSVPQTNITIEKGSIGERNYTANWKVQEYKISYNLNGGSANSLITSYNIESNTITLPTPTRIGYTFEGWTGTGLNGLTKSVSINKGNVGDHNYTANWKVINYTISYDLDGGSASSLVEKYNVETFSFTLATPTRTGYTFAGWTGTDVSSASKNVSINKGSIGNRSYKANWNVNYYTVNYYVEDSLWATRQVAYNTTPENLDAQSALDIYHKFNHWDGWVDKMPTNTVNLYANITESYCMLMTGHGEYGNAEGLLNVFKSAGWTGRIEPAPSAPGFYWVVTDYTLTRAQADIQREYIANHTNYTNYNFPYLYWVSVSCTNGIGDTWTRSVGTKKFTSQY